MGDEGLRSVGRAHHRAVPVTPISTCRAAAAGTDKLLTPIKTHRLGAMLPGRLDRIGLELVPAAPGTRLISRSSAFAALPSVVGGPGSDFIVANP
jgi:hypothetical protein